MTAELPDDALRMGDRVRLLEGDYAHFEARVVELDSDGSARVLVNVFGQEIELHMRRTALRPLSAH